MPSPENEEAEEGEMVRGSPAPSAQVSFKSEAARTDGFPIRFYIFQTTQPADEEEMLPSHLKNSSSGGSTKSDQIL